ncbi:hypothetical protein QJ854_gp535 [Moumouvirus goulette]|uniref:Uncharacterized protein n=1 Tax=Moumouvirus goulette TaxID=1247379 RepID=M1PWV9_9VIRU|nr:hypothetical protein QJ854_gp535 [Moumouvirus goulette]AGF85247.1 hypothetical protein glt_00438 [Moumouvirus goulette]
MDTDFMSDQTSYNPQINVIQKKDIVHKNEKLEKSLKKNYWKT